MAVSEKRYVALWYKDDPSIRRASLGVGDSDLQQLRDTLPEADIFELGPKVPDYGPLLAWLRGQDSDYPHDGECAVMTLGKSDDGCTCGLAPALKAAGTE